MCSVSCTILQGTYQQKNIQQYTGPTLLYVDMLECSLMLDSDALADAR
jgi:hypothetical protein